MELWDAWLGWWYRGCRTTCHSGATAGSPPSFVMRIITPASICSRANPLLAPGSLAGIEDRRAFLLADQPETQLETLRRRIRTGRPLGAPAFLAELEVRTGRILTPQKRGPKPREEGKETRKE